MDKAQVRKSLLKRYSLVLLVLAVYYVLRSRDIITIRCPFRLITGHRCPGCGATAMCLHLAKGEIKEAFRSNAVLFFLFPLMAAAASVKLIFVPRSMMSDSKAYRITVLTVIVILLAFWILRNIIGI